MPTKEIKGAASQGFVQSMFRLIPANTLAQIVFFRHAYLNFSLELGGVQQGHFEGGGFQPFGAFLGRFEVFVRGRLLRHVVRFPVFIQIFGVLFLNTET